MDKNEQCRRLCMLRDRLKRECVEAKQKYKECVEELELVEALLKQLSSTLVIEQKKQELFARSGAYGQSNGSMRNAESHRERTRDYASRSDVYFGQSAEQVEKNIAKRFSDVSDMYFGKFSEQVEENNARSEKVQDINDTALDFFAKDSSVVDKNVRDKVPENVIPVGNANNTIDVEQMPVRHVEQLVVESPDPYAIIEADDRKDYESFMKAYMEGTLPEVKCKVLGVSQNLSNFTREKWEGFEGKDEISLLDCSGGKYWAYPIDAGERRYFLVPSKNVKFQYLNCINSGFPAFFDFDMDKATGDMAVTPVVVLPAIVERDTEGRYFRAGQGNEYPPKGKLKL